MKTKLFIAIAIFTCVTIGRAQLSWQPFAAAPKSYRLDDFHFINPRQGWAISPCYNYLTPHKPGQIYKTNDGGVNWQVLVNNSTTFFRSIGFADSLTGWVGNLGDSVSTPDTIPLYHTTDGGHTWHPVTNIPNPQPKGICGISVVTDSIVYAYGRYYGPPVLLKTVDKGATWTSTDMSPYASGLVDAHFFNKDTGFVTGCIGNTSTQQQQALILSTFDGGATWQTRHISTRPDEEVWKISFPSRNIGYASIEFQGYNPNNVSTYFLKTTDGGLTWVDMPFLAPNTYYDLEGIGFINDSTGWIGGDNCAPTYKTTNGGLTWNPDLTLGTRTSYYECSSGPATGIAMNRFRRFGDTLMYASGYTVCRLSAPLVPIPYFKASATLACQGATITFSDSTSNTKVTSWQWNFPGATLVSGFNLTDSMPQVTYSTPGMYAVSYTASTTKGSASITKTNYINIASATAMYNTAFTEGFETASVPGADWSVAHTPSNGVNFSVTNTAAATGSKSIMIDNFSNTPGDTSYLMSPTFDLSAIGSPILKFKMSYQQKATTNVDKLQILSSTDCGTTWVSRFGRAGTALQPATVTGQSTTPFIPTASQFATYTVNIGPIASSTNAMFRFVFFAGANGQGNNLYIDDINVTNSTVGIKNIETEMDLEVYPNPSSGNINIVFNLNEKHNLAINVIDMLGRVVEANPTQSYTSGQTHITLGNKTNYQSGVYFINIDVDGQHISKKIIIQQ
jgi:photosystem II stability/assembly factor-like uncharacterized protein/PKD repeat protein